MQQHLRDLRVFVTAGAVIAGSLWLTPSAWAQG